jgi:hypothetical protein
MPYGQKYEAWHEVWHKSKRRREEGENSDPW